MSLPARSPWGAVAGSGPAQRAENDRGVESRHYRLPSLVLCTAVKPAACPGLLQGVTGQHPVANRRPGVEGDPGEAVGHRLTDVLEVGCATANHRADAHGRIHTLGGGAASAAHPSSTARARDACPPRAAWAACSPRAAWAACPSRAASAAIGAGSPSIWWPRRSRLVIR